MKYAYVGVTPRTLASGRPLVFGDEVDASALEPADEALKALLIQQPEPPAPTPDPEAK